MKAHTVHNVSTKPILLRHKKSGKELKVQPGINHISDKDFFFFGNQLRNHVSFKMVRELNDTPDADLPFEVVIEAATPAEPTDEELEALTAPVAKPEAKLEPKSEAKPDKKADKKEDKKEETPEVKSE